MRISYCVTGEKRKSLVGAVSQELNAPIRYLGMPSAAYEVGSYTITKTGELIGPDDRDLVLTIQEAHGFAAINEEYDETPDIDQHHPGQYADPGEPPTEAMLKQAEAWTEGMPACEAFGRTTEADIPDRLTIEMPLEGFDDTALANLEKMVASKATLIRKALGADVLSIERTEGKLRFPWFHPTSDGETLDAYARFIVALCDAAKTQKRVTARETPVENEKFAFRVFLIRLGMVGDEYKYARKLLLCNLRGNSAFKNGKSAKENAEVAEDD
jgi:hypothetical protein